jgi:hypothetical protein
LSPFAVDADGVAADLFRLDGVPDRGAFVDDSDSGGLDAGKVRFRVATGGFDEADAFLNADTDIAGIIRSSESRQEGEVNPERLVGQRPAFADLCPETIGVREGQGGQEAYAACVRHSRDQLGFGDPHEAALHNGPFDAEEFGDAGPHRVSSPYRQKKAVCAESMRLCGLDR